MIGFLSSLKNEAVGQMIIPEIKEGQNEDTK
jgi:hypothetical protein